MTTIRTGLLAALCALSLGACVNLDPAITVNQQISTEIEDNRLAFRQLADAYIQVYIDELNETRHQTFTAAIIAAQSDGSIDAGEAGQLIRGVDVIYQEHLDRLHALRDGMYANIDQRHNAIKTANGGVTRAMQQAQSVNTSAGTIVNTVAGLADFVVPGASDVIADFQRRANAFLTASASSTT